MLSPSLAETQRLFAAAMLTGDAAAIAPYILADGILPERRLAIYRNSARSAMTAALRLTYPAVERLVGPDFFAMASARFVRRHPPDSACLDDYGSGFAGFLAEMAECAGLPYLPDVARFEHALSVAAQAPDVPALDVAALLKYRPAAHALLRFMPHPSVTLLCLASPADRIADAVLSGQADALNGPSLDEGPVHLVVHRGPGGVAAERLTPESHAFLVRLFAGEPLGQVLDGAVPDVANILARQFTQGRVSYVQEVQQ